MNVHVISFVLNISMVMNKISYLRTLASSAYMKPVAAVKKMSRPVKPIEP